MVILMLVLGLIVLTDRRRAFGPRFVKACHGNGYLTTGCRPDGGCVRY